MLNSLDFLVLRSLGEKDESADEIAQRDATGAATASRVKPIGYGPGDAVAEDVLHKVGTGKKLCAASQTLESLTNPLQFRFGHWEPERKNTTQLINIYKFKNTHAAQQHTIGTN